MGDPARRFAPPRTPQVKEPGWKARREVVRRLGRLQTLTERRDLCTAPEGLQGRSGWVAGGPGAGVQDGAPPVPVTVPVDVAVDGVPVRCGGRATRWGCDWRRHADRIAGCGSGRILGADGTWGPTRCRSPWCPTCVYRAGRSRSARWVRRAQALAECPTVQWALVTLTCAMPPRPCHVSDHEWRQGWRPVGGVVGDSAGPVDVADQLASLQARWRKLRQGARGAIARQLGYLYAYETTTTQPVVDAYWDREGNRWRCRVCGETGARWWRTVKGRRQPCGPSVCPGCSGRQMPAEHLHIHIVVAVDGNPMGWGLGVAWRWLELCRAEGVEADPMAQDVGVRPPERVAYVVAYPGTDPSLHRTDGQWVQWWAGVRGAHLWQAGGGWHRGTARYRQAVRELGHRRAGLEHSPALAALAEAWERVPPEDDDGGWSAMALVDPRTGLPEELGDREGTVLGRGTRARPRISVVGPWGESVPVAQALVGRRLLATIRGTGNIGVWFRKGEEWTCEVVAPQRIVDALDAIPPPSSVLPGALSPWDKPGRYPRASSGVP